MVPRRRISNASSSALHRSSGTGAGLRRFALGALYWPSSPRLALGSVLLAGLRRHSRQSPSSLACLSTTALRDTTDGLPCSRVRLTNQRSLGSGLLRAAVALSGAVAWGAALSSEADASTADVTLGGSSVVSHHIPLSLPLFRLFRNNETSCESAAESDRTAGASDDLTSDGATIDQDDDPYDNLPEEDEDTHCSMCNTFRQGPCRPFWRKLERCFKDHESEENGAVQCMKYFSPHQHCLQQYLNLYQLVSLQMKQELVRDTERAVESHERQSWDVTVDWGLWKQFIEEQGRDWKQTVRRTVASHEGTAGEKEDIAAEDLLPLWQRLPENTEPVLLTVSSHLPQRKDGMILKIAYAIDQDGFVLGFTYNQAFQALLEKAMKKEEPATAEASTTPPAVRATVTADSIDSEETTQPASPVPASADDQYFQLDFVLLPGETQSIRVCAMYSENPVEAGPEKDLLDVTLFTSPSYPVEAGNTREQSC